MSQSALAQKTEIEIEGQKVTLEEASIKCKIGELPNISIKRLANCNSARFVEMSHGDRTLTSVKFKINPDDTKISDGVRAELRDMHEAVNGDETWYRLSTLLPEDFPGDAKHRLVLSQWHEHVRNDGASLRPPLSHRLWNGRFVVTLWNRDLIAQRGLEGDGDILFELPELERGVFNEFVYKVVWSPGDDGRIVGWLRQCPILDPECGASPWTEIISYSGSTGYDDADVAGYYFKFGLYTVTDFDVSFTAFHRGYQVGGSAAEVGLTDPLFK